VILRTELAATSGCHGRSSPASASRPEPAPERIRRHERRRGSSEAVADQDRTRRRGSCATDRARCGSGFGPQAMDRIFEAFYTTKTEGMGMGLSVSRSIIEDIMAVYAPAPNDGPGATFSFSIPCGPASATGARSLGVIGTPAVKDAKRVQGIRDGSTFTSIGCR